MPKTIFYQLHPSNPCQIFCHSTSFNLSRSRLREFLDLWCYHDSWFLYCILFELFTCCLLSFYIIFEPPTNFIIALILLSSTLVEVQNTVNAQLGCMWNHLGFWAKVDESFPLTGWQCCRLHNTANITYKLSEISNPMLNPWFMIFVRLKVLSWP